MYPPVLVVLTYGGDTDTFFVANDIEVLRLDLVIYPKRNDNDLDFIFSGDKYKARGGSPIM